MAYAKLGSSRMFLGIYYENQMWFYTYSADGLRLRSLLSIVLSNICAKYSWLYLYCWYNPRCLVKIWVIPYKSFATAAEYSLHKRDTPPIAFFMMDLHVVSCHSDAPNIHLFVIRLHHPYLGGHVDGSPASCIQFHISKNLADSEIR